MMMRLVRLCLYLLVEVILLTETPETLRDRPPPVVQIRIGSERRCFLRIPGILRRRRGGDAPVAAEAALGKIGVADARTCGVALARAHSALSADGEKQADVVDAALNGERSRVESEESRGRSRV